MDLNLIKVRFRVLHSAKPGTMRSEIVEGFCKELPEVGAQFVMAAKSLAPVPAGTISGRWVNTSVVESIEQSGNVYVLTTASGSKYEVTRLGEN